MSDNDLRPPGGRERFPGPQPVAPSAARWWEPLTTKWGILGVLIFVGLIIGLVNSLFSSGTTSTRTEESQRIEKQDAATTGKQLIAMLSSLTGEDPKQFEQAEKLAKAYRDRWWEEERKRQNAMSNISKEELKEKRNQQYQKTSSQMYDLFSNRQTSNQAIVAALSEGMEGLSGEWAHEYANRLIGRIRKQAQDASQMPRLANEIRELLIKWKAAPEEQRPPIYGDIRKRMFAYYDVLEHAPVPNPGSPQERDAARAALGNVDQVPYDRAVEIIVQNMPKVWKGNSFDAVSKLLRIQQGLPAQSIR